MKRILTSPNRTRGIGSKAGTAAIFLILLLAGSFSMLPLVYSVVQSVKPMEELFVFPPRFWVSNPTGENYRELFRLTDSLWVSFSRYLFNSIFVSLVGTVVYVLIASTAAYSLTIGKFRGKMLLNQIVVKALLFSSGFDGVAVFDSFQSGNAEHLLCHDPSDAGCAARAVSYAAVYGADGTLCGN